MGRIRQTQQFSLFSFLPQIVGLWDLILNAVKPSPGQNSLGLVFSPTVVDIKPAFVLYLSCRDLLCLAAKQEVLSPNTIRCLIHHQRSNHYGQEENTHNRVRSTRC